MDASLPTYADFLETIPDAALLVDNADQVVFANELLCNLFDWPVGSLAGQPIEVLIPTDIRGRHHSYTSAYRKEPVRRPMGSGRSLSAQRTGGQQFPVDIMLSPVRLEGRDYVLCVVRDLTRQQMQEARLRDALAREKQLAMTDPLTGAANVRQLRHLLDAEIERHRRHQHPFTLGYIDLDHFKAVNDRFGHSEGDRVLRTVVKVVQSRLRTNDTFARVGGDEFAVLLPETGLDEAKTVISDLMVLLGNAMDDSGWPVTFSCGAVAFHAPPPSTDHALHVADRLMYETKDGGRNACRFTCFGASKSPSESEIETS